MSDSSRHYYRDRTGKPIDKGEWRRLVATPDYRIVRVTRGADHIITTVWLGYSSHIFETSVQAIPTNGSEAERLVVALVVDQERHETECLALAWHDSLLSKYGTLIDRIGAIGRGTPTGILCDQEPRE